MILDHESQFGSPELDSLRRGSVTMHAPILRDIVQINAGESDGSAILEVTKSDTEVKVSRQDKELLQVSVNIAREDEHLGYILESGTLLQNPVPELFFVKRTLETAVYNPHWFAGGEGVSIKDLERMHLFAKTLGNFMLLKQLRAFLNSTPFSGV